MNVTVLRKGSFFKKLPRDLKILGDGFEISVVYRRFLLKNLPQGVIVSSDFKKFRKECNLMKYFPQKAVLKIAARHGTDLETEPLGVVVDTLSCETREILISVALEVRFLNIYSSIPRKEFDFLEEEAGTNPIFRENFENQEKITLFLGKEFIIKESRQGIIYYDVLPYFPDCFRELKKEEAVLVFSEYLKENSGKSDDVKIRELMSK